MGYLHLWKPPYPLIPGSSDDTNPADCRDDRPQVLRCQCAAPLHRWLSGTWPVGRPWDGASSCDPTDPIQNDVKLMTWMVVRTIPAIPQSKLWDYEVAVGIFSHSHLVLDPTHSGFMGVSINGGTPISGSKWMVYFMEKTNLTWFVGTPMDGSTPNMMMLTRKNGDSMGLNPGLMRYIYWEVMGTYTLW